MTRCIFPWGNEFDEALVPRTQFGGDRVGVVYVPRDVPGSASPFGLMGLVGGQAEWVSSDDASNPTVRGGNGITGIEGIGLMHRDGFRYSAVVLRRQDAVEGAGVRCVYPAPEVR